MKKFGTAPVEKIVCDCCGREDDASLAPEYSTFIYKSYGHFGDYHRNEWGTERIDICDTCARKIREAVKRNEFNRTVGS